MSENQRLLGMLRALADVKEESGVFTAPWTGIHGWYLKNDSAKDVVARLELAGFYALHAK